MITYEFPPVELAHCLLKGTGGTSSVWTVGSTLKMIRGHHVTNGFPWWRYQMETFSALLDLCAGNWPVTSEFPSQRPVTRSFDVFFDLRLYKRLSKQSWAWWFETSSRSLWRRSNAIAIWIRWKFRFTLSSMLTQWSLPNLHMARQLCAVVACAKICCNLMASNGITPSQNFHRIWMVGKISFVKRGPAFLRCP